MDPFIVYTSNVFAILGLRALYFMLAGVMQMFVYLKFGLSFVLCFVGAKMLVVDVYKIPIGISLGVVAGILILSVAVSLIVRWKREGLLLRRLGLGKFSIHKARNRPHPITMPAYTRVVVLILLVAVVLGIAKWDSIVTGPSGDDAIAAIRVVQRELAEMRLAHASSHAPILYGANATLDEAWSKLEEKRYAEAIAAAHKARQLLQTLPR
jgi:hypothetical protein